MSRRVSGAESTTLKDDSYCPCDKEIVGIVGPIINGVRKAVIDPVVAGTKEAVLPSVTYLYKDIKSIDRSGNYTLAENMSNEIEIIANNVYLNFVGFKAKVKIVGVNNVRLSNGISESISVEKSSDITIYTFRMKGPMMIKDSSNVIVSRITFNSLDTALSAYKVQTLIANNLMFRDCVNCVLLKRVDNFSNNNFTNLTPSKGYGNVLCTKCSNFSITSGNDLGLISLVEVNNLVVSMIKSSNIQIRVTSCSAGLIEQLISSNVSDNWVSIENSKAVMILSSTCVFESTVNDKVAVSFDVNCQNCCCKECIIEGAGIGISMKGDKFCNQAYQNKLTGCVNGIVCSKHAHRNVALGNHALFSTERGFVGVSSIKAPVNKLGTGGIDFYANLSVNEC